MKQGAKYSCLVLYKKIYIMIEYNGLFRGIPVG